MPALPEPLSPDELYRPADLGGLHFETTNDLDPIELMGCQPRAEAALRLGARIGNPGFNVYVAGSPDGRLSQAVKELLGEFGSDRSPGMDWVYVNNFEAPNRPLAIELPPGGAPALRDAMHELVDDLLSALPAVFESEDYHVRRSAIDEAARTRHENALSAVRDKALERGIVILRTPMGFAMAPIREGKVVTPEEFGNWPEPEREAVQQEIQALEPELEQTLRAIPRWEKERREAVRGLERDTARMVVEQFVQELKSRFSGQDRVQGYLDAVSVDMVENLGLFVAAGAEEAAEHPRARAGGPLDRYAVNVLVTQAGLDGAAPIVEEPHPTLGNLTGRIEHLSQQGMMVTNFRLIRAGALHRANGGIMLLDARSVLSEPFSWQALKRALQRREIVIEDFARVTGLTSTVTLEPEPIPLDIKVVLVGDRFLYHLLLALDPEAGQHFKVLADFDDEMDRAPASEQVLARLVAALARSEGMRPLDRQAVARTVEHAARLADDSGKLSLMAERYSDLLAEASFTAAEAGRDVVTVADIEHTIATQLARASRPRDLGAELIQRDVILIDTRGSAIGQANGLSVFMHADFAFGRPARITCRVRPGSGTIVDIEREVELGGPIHSKGVLVLTGFLAGRYALETPMSLFASLVMEQSYGELEGDSASSAELYALLSAIGEFPLRQDLAVTGSVNQHGQIQAVGGINAKVEGFYDACEARGLTGTQGVLIPVSNVRNLMLRSDVIKACRAGRFAIYPVRTVDEGIGLLGGIEAGERGSDGSYPEGSANRCVEDRLRSFAAALRESANGKRGTGP